MIYTVCEKCDKELDLESIIFQKVISYMPSPEGPLIPIPEWKEVGWQEGKAEQAKTGWLQDGLKKEIPLCSSCAEQFRKKIQRDEWLGSIFIVAFVLLVIFGLLVYGQYFLCSKGRKLMLKLFTDSVLTKRSALCTHPLLLHQCVVHANDLYIPPPAFSQMDWQV